MKASQLEKSDLFIGLLASRSGHGKTSAIASFAELGPVYLMDLDRRARGMFGCSHIKKEWLDRIEIDQSIDYTKGFTEIDKKLEIFLIQAKSNSLPYKTIGVESFGSLVKTLLLDSQRLRGLQNKDGKIRGTMKFFTPDDYNYASMAMNQIIYTCLLQLKCNLILSGWIVDRYGRPIGTDDYAPAQVIGQKMLGPANLAEEIVGYFDEVYFLEKEETGISTEPLKYTVKFEGNLAKTSKQELRGKGEVDITNKSFYQTYRALLNGEQTK